jgi:hypothetical protein
MPISTYEVNNPGTQFSNLVTEYLWETERSFEIGDEPVRINWVREFSEYDELGRGEVTVTVNYTSSDDRVHSHLYQGTFLQFAEELTQI